MCLYPYISKSKEFANTHSLAMHAFNSTKARCRAEHLGFHKALCLLLGWCATAASDGLWVQKMLPAAEASNLKNDLIVWPPVVVVHNSSITHCDPDKRMIVSVEGLEAILRGEFYSFIVDGLLEIFCSKYMHSSHLSSCKLLKKFYDFTIMLYCIFYSGSGSSIISQLVMFLFCRSKFLKVWDLAVGGPKFPEEKLETSVS